MGASNDGIENGPWWSDEWFVSPSNYDPALRATMELPEQVVIHDATLRDGEQTPGVVLRRADKLAIAKELDAAGVQRIEAGMPAVSDEDYAAISDIVQAGPKAKIYAFARAMIPDLELVLRSGAHGVVIEVPSGYLRLKHQYGWSEADVIARALEAVRFAKSAGLEVVFFPFDGARASGPFYEELISRVWSEAAPDSVCVVDTVGATLPDALAATVRRVRSLVDGPVEVHTHNDFGMGVAASLSAVMAGAEVVHVCVNGLGERTGNASLDEVAVSSKVMLGLDTQIDLTRMKRLSVLVEERTGIRLAANKPVVGDLAFAREIGLGIELVKTHQRTVFPFIPSMVGMEPRVVIGKKSGVRSIALKLEEWGLAASDEVMREVLAEVKRSSIELGRHLSDQEVRGIYERTAIPTA